MYTGRITDIGTVVENGESAIHIRMPRLARELVCGGSVNVNGVCLSATSIDGDLVVADATPETRRRTRLADLGPGAVVNLERPLRAGEPLDGHLVQGHVDAVGKVVRVEDEGAGARKVWIKPPGRVLDTLAPKGSVGIDGVSLTVADIVRDRFSVALIPITLSETTLGTLQVDDRVHLETDVVAKFASSGCAGLSSVTSGLGWSGVVEGAAGVQQAAAQLAAGGGVVVWDPDREGEGDVVYAGEGFTPASMAFILTEARGHTTVPCSLEVLDRLEIPAMTGSGDRHGTAFHNSVDLACSAGTGVSAHDRAATIRRLAAADASPADFCQPGHVFPLAGRPGGLAERRGHTEASLELCRLAGRAPVAVICEVMGDDGHMLDAAGMERWSLRHALPMVSIADITAHAPS